MFGAIPGLCWVILYWLVSAVSVCDASVDTIVELAIRFPVVKCRRVTMPLNVYGLHFETIAQGPIFGTMKKPKEEEEKMENRSEQQVRCSERPNSMEPDVLSATVMIIHHVE